MPRPTQTPLAVQAPVRVRRGYFECRYGQLHVHNAMPPGGGFEEGMPLLCIHDLTGSGRTFTRFLALVGEDRSAYAPDLPGFGESDAPASRPTISDFAAALGDFLDSLRLRRVGVLGLRAGALLATELAIQRPAQVSRVLMVSVPLLTEAERQARAAGSRADSAIGASEPLKWTLEAAAHYPLRERLPKLTQRVLVLRPRDDLWEPTARVRELLPAARLADLEQPAAELFGAAAQRAAEAVQEFLHI